MTIRPATTNDWSHIGRLSELLVRAHHAYDASRFIHPDVLPGDVYTARVRSEVDQGQMMLRVAETDGKIVGFVLAGIEPESWKELRHEAGYVHDIVVDEAHRHAGIGGALFAAALDWFEARGTSRVMLWTAPQNFEAQRLFRRVGFRPTMIEMTLVRAER
jgi:ribosomal protein S18 acetylase RimI-like enzyme